jgi:hypothetical protein
MAGIMDAPAATQTGIWRLGKTDRPSSGPSHILGHQRGDAGDMGLGNAGNVASPILPIIAAATFLDDLCHDGAGKFVEHERALALSAVTGLAVAAARFIIAASAATTNMALAFAGLLRGWQFVADRDHFDLVADSRRIR